MKPYITNYTRTKIEDLPSALEEIKNNSSGYEDSIKVEVIGKISTKPVDAHSLYGYFFSRGRKMTLTDFQGNNVNLFSFQNDLFTARLEDLYQQQLTLAIKGSFTDFCGVEGIYITEADLFEENKGALSIVSNLEAAISLAEDGKISLK